MKEKINRWSLKIGLFFCYVAYLLSAWDSLIPRNAVLMAAVFLAVCLICQRKPLMFEKRLQGVSVIYIFVLAVVSFWSQTPLHSFDKVISDMMIYMLIAIIALPVLLNDERRIDIAKTLLTISILVGSLSVIGQGLMGHFREYYLPSEPAVAAFAVFAVLYLSFSLSYMVNAPSRQQRIIFIVVNIIVIWALIWNGMRGSWLAFVAQILVLAFLNLNWKKSVGLILALILMGTIIFTTPLIAQRVEGIKIFFTMNRGKYDFYVTNPAAITPQVASALSIWERLFYTQAGFEMGRDHWLTGVGVDNFNKNLPTYWLGVHWERGAPNAYNSFAQMFAIAGVWGELILLMMIVGHLLYFGKYARKAATRWEGQTGILLVTAFVVNSFSECVIHSRMWMMMYWLVLCLAASSIYCKSRSIK